MNIQPIAGLIGGKEDLRRRMNCGLTAQSYQVVKKDNIFNAVVEHGRVRCSMRCVHTVSPALSPSPIIPYRDGVQG